MTVVFIIVIFIFMTTIAIRTFPQKTTSKLNPSVGRACAKAKGRVARSESTWAGRAGVTGRAGRRLA